MTIRKGHEWGNLAVAPESLMTVRSDADLRVVVETARRAGAEVPTVGLLGGDLMRTLGGSGDASRFHSGEPIPHLPIDVVHLVADDLRETWFVAHLVARRSWWRGAITAAMNAQFLGTWDVSPRCHPNDGRVDVVQVSPNMTMQQRWMARSRVSLGTHVPHPLITIEQRFEFVVDLARETPLRVDGQRWGSGRVLHLRVEPDAFVVCV